MHLELKWSDAKFHRETRVSLLWAVRRWLRLSRTCYFRSRLNNSPTQTAGTIGKG